MSDMNRRSGLAFALLAYGLWGVFPLYFMQMAYASAVEIVANRIVWSMLLCVAILAMTRHLGDLRLIAGDAHQRRYLLAAAVLISLNWTAYVYAANNGQILQASLGYFINPLVTVVLAVLILRERLRLGQWLAIALALIGVVTLGLAYGHPPWIALVLAFSFGLYGLSKNFAGRRTGAVQSLAVETLLLTPFALGVLAWLATRGEIHYATHGWVSFVWLMSTGVATTLPLGSFAAAARRLPLSALGMLQYLTPSLQFVVGAVIAHETMTPLSWIGFTLIWLALALFSVDAMRAARRSRRAQRQEAEREVLQAQSQEVH